LGVFWPKTGPFTKVIVKISKNSKNNPTKTLILNIFQILHKVSTHVGGSIPKIKSM
jgi:hypothetical protein